MTPTAAARDAMKTLAGLSRPAASFDASRYFRGADRHGFRNVGAPRVRCLARDIHAAHRTAWTVDDALAFAETTMRSRFLEDKGVGIELLARYRRAFAPRHLSAWKRWLASDLASNWATTDAMCGLLIGPLLVARPAVLPRVAAWAGDRNLWVRRASAVALIPSVRRGPRPRLRRGHAPASG
jgi:3-methyladenine DNA glycosylase AlkD